MPPYPPALPRRDPTAAMRPLPTRKALNRRLAAASRAMARALGLAAVAVPAGAAAYCFAAPGWAARHPWLTGLDGVPPVLDPVGSACLLAGMAVALAPLVWGVLQLRLLFRGYGSGQVLTAEAASRFDRFARSLLAAAVAGPLGSLVASAALSAAGRLGTPGLSLAFGSDEAWLALLGGVLLLIARVMLDAALLAADDAQIL